MFRYSVIYVYYHDQDHIYKAIIWSSVKDCVCCLLGSLSMYTYAQSTKREANAPKIE